MVLLVVDEVLSDGQLVFLICSLPPKSSSSYSQLTSMMTNMGHTHTQHRTIVILL